MIPPALRVTVRELINEAVTAGARLFKACEVVGLTQRCLQRWREDGIDRRTTRVQTPRNALSEQEVQTVLATVNSAEFAHLPPTQIVPILADQGRYVASESTIYRVLRREKQLRHRRLERQPRKRALPRALVATGPNQVASWDITYLPSTVRGQYWYLYAVLDLFSRKTVAWQVYANESQDGLTGSVQRPRTECAHRLQRSKPFNRETAMSPDLHTLIEIKRNCEVTMIPRGEVLTLWQGDRVVLTQALGGSFTVRTEMGYLVRVAALDADALGLEDTSEQATPVDAGPFTIDKVTAALKTVFDPEIPVNVVDLGLIYLCAAHPLVDGGHRIEIKMSMTAPGCGMGDVLKEDARAKVQAVPGVAEVDIEIIWEPAWEQSRMSEAAKLQLGLF